MEINLIVRKGNKKICLACSQFSIADIENALLMIKNSYFFVKDKEGWNQFIKHDAGVHTWLVEDLGKIVSAIIASAPFRIHLGKNSDASEECKLNINQESWIFVSSKGKVRIDPYKFILNSFDNPSYDPGDTAYEFWNDPKEDKENINVQS